MWGKRILHTLNIISNYINTMSTLQKILSTTSITQLGRSGLASKAQLALEAVAQGKSSIILVQSREEFNNVRALLQLFTPEISLAAPDIHKPRWQSPILSLPPGVLQTGLTASWADRMAAFYALQYGKATCLVLTPDNLLIKYMPRDFFDTHELILQKGADMSPELLIEQAIEWNYERVQMVTRKGDIARRGDILDIFPPGYEKPVRIEFFGDIIEDMRLFDAVSQRSLMDIAEITLIPPLPITASSPWQKKAQERFQRLLHKGFIDENALHDFKKNLLVGGTGLLPGIFYDAPTVLEEWLPKDTVWLLPGLADTKDCIESTKRILSESVEDDTQGITAKNKELLMGGRAIQVAQPARMALREASSALALLEGKNKVFYFEPLIMGVGKDLHKNNTQKEHEDLPEKEYRNFTELFPMPNAMDRPWQQLMTALKEWQGNKRQVLLSFTSERSRAKFLSLAEQDGIHPHLRYLPHSSGLFALISPWRSGIELLWDNVLVLGEDIIYPKAEKRSRIPTGAFKGLDTFDDIVPGDLLVHRDYGIARFMGLHRLERGEAANDFLLLEYSGADKLYVPADRLSLIQRFKGSDGAEPSLDRLGASHWQNSKDKARKAIEKIAADLVEMYAFRKVAKGFTYSPPDELYREFEATFGFEETPDQAKAIHDVLDDMEKSQPMDRLVCGDVGFGKTEVALRAAFRAAAEGRQVAMLCPTTVLAEQHYQTFRQRLAGFPVHVGLLSRFVNKAKQKEVLKASAEGNIDILIGTHRMLSKDVALPNLALLILDEEQRFGVRHKEKLKALKKNVDALTLTATPIPRTLQLSMSGIRDLSLIETAPPERKPVATAILQKDGKVLKDILERELAREGQVFWVYNRVQGLERTAEYVRNLVTTARVGMAHGQMAEKELESTMHRFWHGELDVLVCTSIVESGLDFPRANTLVVDQAHMFGLGQLYQLRGRVGRSDRQAYAYFVIPEEHRLSDIARERMRIILEMDYLGAGFQVAMEDLRLRGAGNILGEVQSGHMSRLGLDLFLEMLEEAVSRLKGTPSAVTSHTELNIGVPAHIPECYVQDGRERLRYYKSLSSATTGALREEIALGMRDRFGSFPPEFTSFLAILSFKELLSTLEAQRADIFIDKVVIHWNAGQKNLDGDKLVACLAKEESLKLYPPATLEIRLDVLQKTQNNAAPENSFAKALELAGTVLMQLKKEPDSEKEIA